MNNKDYINDIISYLKDDRPAHAYASMRRYMKHLGYTENEICEENINVEKLLHEKDIKINTLQQKLCKQEKITQKILSVRKMSKLLYWVAIFIGIAVIITGLLIENGILYVISGACIFIVGITGLYEAITNKW